MLLLNVITISSFDAFSCNDDNDEMYSLSIKMYHVTLFNDSAIVKIHSSLLSGDSDADTEAL